MKKYFILCLFAVLFCCKQEELPENLVEDLQENLVDDLKDDLKEDLKDDLVDTLNFRLVCVRPVATIDAGKVQLKWGPIFYELIMLPYKMVQPDKIDIYISENDMSDFQKINEVEHGGNYTYTIDKLQNGKQYFFYTVSKKDGFKSLISDTIMAVPNERKGFEILQKSEEEHIPSLSHISVSHKKNKVAYVNNYYYWNGGLDCCMASSVLISNIDGSGKELVKIHGYNPSWSPADDKIVFHFDGIHNVGWIPNQLVMYDCKTKSIIQLTDDKFYNRSPVFSKNGESILYQSSKNTSDTYDSNIWLMNLITLESFQVTDIFKASLNTAERPSWIDNDRFLFHGVYYNYGKNHYQIFESSVSKGQITKIIESKWNDYTPSMSSDQKKIAFISDRSGIDHVWVYNIDNNTFSQISGYSYNESVEPSWDNVVWLDNSTIVYTTNGNKLIKQNVE